MLFSEPKIPQSLTPFTRMQIQVPVSVLFSEPKIPQLYLVRLYVFNHIMFQCSSASRKFLNPSAAPRRCLCDGFQCSSASRKFLNKPRASSSQNSIELFQCSSASRKFLNRNATSTRRMQWRVSVLFSEPKIPQFLSAWVAVAVLKFQCSSASRKFLNPDPRTCVHPYFRPR